jgi:hypothetical protein
MGTHKTLLSQMVSSVEGSAMYWATPSGAAAPKIFLLHSESVHLEMILAAPSQHRIQPFPLSLSTPTHTHHRYTSAELIYRHLCTSVGFASFRIASIALPHRQTHLMTVTRLSFHIRSIPRKLTPSQ